MEQRGRDGVHPWSKFCCEFESQKTSRWFPSSAPSQGMQQEFIVTPTQPTTLHRCTQQSTPKNSQRADDRCAFFTIRASLDEHILGLPPWVFCRICRKKTFLFFFISTHQWPKCDHWYQNVWPLKNNSNSRLSDWIVFDFFLRKAHKQKRFPIGVAKAVRLRETSWCKA